MSGGYVLIVLVVAPLLVALAFSVARNRRAEDRIKTLEERVGFLLNQRQADDAMPEAPAWLVNWFNLHFPSWFEQWREDAIRRGKLKP